ncbi:uncharacterized protein LOC115687227 isoform X2 [Syzygium oleosum]|uniref:uncharacterized protein LOC115687227 isoform X2 n=1 Tax=Syzygium oleosum TaxID=219896 RepID=UPI0024B9DA72|nr:uncharacterized protein LOC115687227 isoform X2 [Syzygium oleosum]
MFWRMAGLSTASPVETILDKDNYTLEELLDEDEIIQECKALNNRLINFLREKLQVEQLLRYIVEEADSDADKKRTIKFPFIACEIFTCEVDIILRTLVDDRELMDLLFSFLEPDRNHSTQLAGYFSKVVICLLLRKTMPFMNYIQDHLGLVRQLIDLIGITSIMEVLIRLIGAEEHLYTNYTDAMNWLEDIDVLEMIVDKFSSSDCPEVHANAAETLCAITRFAPPSLATKISSPGFIGRLFRHALEDSRPKSVLVNSLSVCISLLDPKRLTLGPYHTYNRQLTHGSTVTAHPETVEGMLESLGDLLKLLDVSSTEKTLPTTYGKLQPPLGKHRLKIVEFIAVLLTVGSEAAEKELVCLGAVQRILDLFFEYPYNNFLHHHVENIILSCLENKDHSLVDHVLQGCNLIGRILEGEKNFSLTANPDKPTVPAEGRSPPRIGNIGHLTRISNKLVQLGTNNTEIQKYLQENGDWIDWQTNIVSKRNAVENVYQWSCGRPTALQDRTRDSDDDDYQDRDYDVAALANNLSQAFRYGIYSNDDIDEARGSLERDDEDVYFDDESAEVVISSLRLGDDQESVGHTTSSGNDEVTVDEGTDSVPDATSCQEPAAKLEDTLLDDAREDVKEIGVSEAEKQPEWVDWGEMSDIIDQPDTDKPPIVPNGEVEPENSCDHGAESENRGDHSDSDAAEPSPSKDLSVNNERSAGEDHQPASETSSSNPAESVSGHVDPGSSQTDSEMVAETEVASEDSKADESGVEESGNVTPEVDKDKAAGVEKTEN